MRALISHNSPQNPVPRRNSIASLCRHRRGFSILTVVLSMALLASITIGFSSVVQNRTSRIAHEIRAARGQLLAESGVDIAVAIMLGGLSLSIDDPGRMVADGTPLYCSMDEEGALAISIQDVAGLVDLNAASLELLSALLQTAVDEKSAATIAQAIDVRRTATPLRLIEELAQVPEVSAETFFALQPYLTLRSGHTGLAKELVAEPLRSRLAGLAGANAAFFGSQPTNRVFSITVVARQQATAGYVLETVVEVRPGRKRLYRPLRWRGRVVLGRRGRRDALPGMDLFDRPDWQSLPPCVVAAF